MLPCSTLPSLEAKSASLLTTMSDDSAEQLIGGRRLHDVASSGMSSIGADSSSQNPVALLEERNQMAQFLDHIQRAVDDAVLCQRLTLGRDTTPVNPRPCDIRGTVCDIVRQTLPVIAACVRCAVRCTAAACVTVLWLVRAVVCT